MALRFSREEKGKFLSKSTPSEYFSPQGKEKFSIMKSHEFEEVARAMSEDVSNTPYGYVYKPLWDSLWNVRVPGRVKICAWKASMDILPTRAHLHQKGMSLKHRGCMFCDDNSLESSLHVLKDCPYATSVWFSSALAIRTSELQCITVKDWLLHLSIALPASQFAMLMMTLWSIWNERHSLLLGKCKKLSPPDDVARRAQTWLQEFMTLPQNLSPKPLQPNQKWSRPNEGWVKVNVDGVYDRAGSSGGIGVILRDWNGDFHGALTKKIYGGLFSQVDVEVVALREGVRFALDRGYHQVWFESDALNTIIARYNIEYHREEDDEDVYISDSSSDSGSDSDTENDSDGDTAMPASFTPVSRVARMVLDNLRGPKSSLLPSIDHVHHHPAGSGDSDTSLYVGLFSSIDPVIEDTRAMLRGFQGEPGLTHIHPSANSVARRLATHALCMKQRDYCCWFKEPPNFILDVLLEDCNISPTLK